MPEDALLDPLLKSPQLVWYRERIDAILAEERARRERFYDEMDESHKMEFINGEVIVHSPARNSHNQTAKFLLMLVDTFVRKHKLGQAGFEKYLVSLTRNDYEPDVLFWKAARARTFTRDQLQFPAPDFIAEILSQSTEANDRGVKFIDYAAHGVGEYWIIDADLQTVEKYVLTGKTYALALKVNSGTIKSDVIEGFEIPVVAIFDEQANLAELSRILGSR